MFDDDYLDEEVFGTGSRKGGPGTTHCNVPLKFSTQRAALSLPAPGQFVSRSHPAKRELMAIEEITGRSHYHFLEMSRQQYLLLNTLKIPDKPEVQLEFNQQYQVSDLLNRINLEAINSVGHIPLTSPASLIGTQARQYLYTSYLIRCFFEEGVMTSGSDHRSPCLWWKKSESGVSIAQVDDVFLYVTKNLFLIRSREGSSLVSRDHLTILSDLASQRYLLRLNAILEEHEKVPSFVSPSYLDELLINGDLLLYHGGNRSYKLVYGLEPLCISMLVGSIPVGHSHGLTFHQTIIQDQAALAGKLGVYSLWKERIRLLEQIRGSPNLIAQVFGLFRIWGHPTVEPLEGTSALKKIATVVRAVHLEKVQRILGKFKEEFIIRFINRYHKWPALDCSMLSPLNVIREAYDQQGIYPISHRRYNRKHLDLVEFDQCFPIDPKFDLIEMLSDKALSLPTDELIKNLRKNKGVGSSIDRSVLVNWLKSQLHDPTKLLQAVSEHGFPIFEKSVGLKEKEREGKIDARMFGLMTLIKRMYIVLTEALLAEHILPLFPEITMVDDEISLDKKKHSFTNRKDKRLSFYTSLDFSKWNTNMREHETLSLFAAFDRLFGMTQVFSRTHEMFKDSFLYLLNGSYQPTLGSTGFVQDMGGWLGHLGGIEGLRQKGWTIWTVCLILLASEGHPLVLKLMGSGDNQILKEIFPLDVSRKRALEIHFAFISSLNEILKHVGPPLKMEETWTSECLFIYGKYIMLDGAPLETYAKRICRMFRMSNEDYPTLESALSSLTANLSSALACSHSPHHLYFIYCIELTGLFQLYFRKAYLQRQPLNTVLSGSSAVKIPTRSRPIYRSNPALLLNGFRQDNDLYIKLALLPRCLGGFPILNLLQCLLRGFPDEVSLAISSLNLLHRYAPPSIQSYIARILQPPLSSSTNYQMLFEHPTALNLEIPPAPSESRRNLVLDFLKQTPRISNHYFMTFLAILRGDSEDRLVEYLSTAEPFNPRMLGLIVGATVEARARHMAGRLQKTKTVSDLARLEGGKDLYSTIEAAELNHTTSVLRLITVTSECPVVWYPNKCSVTHASELRNIGWKKTIVGVDCVPPYEFMKIEPVYPHSTCPIECELEKGYIRIHQQLPGTVTGIHSPLKMGGHTPYRGSVTRQKVTGYGDKLASQADPLLSKVLKLFSLLSWAVPKVGNISTVISNLLASRTDLDHSLLIPDEDELPGSVHHRLQDERTGHGGAVGLLPNYGSYLGFDTFPLTEYSKGSKNVNLMFQSLMSLSVVLRSWAMSTGIDKDAPIFHVHVKSSCCIRPVIEDLVDCPEPYDYKIPCHKDNPYLFVSAASIIGNTNRLNLFPVTLDPAFQPEEASLRLAALLGQEIVSMLNPGLWEMSHREFPKHSLLINWALRCPVLLTMEYVALYLVTYFLPSARSNETVSEFLIRLHERVRRSRIDDWTQLSNLNFAPNFHHELVKEPYNNIISGNPNLTPEILASNIRNLVSSIILSWSSSEILLHRALDLQLYASPACGFNYHPALQCLSQDTLKSGDFHLYKSIRQTILLQLGSKDQLPERFIPHPLAIPYLKRGLGRITRDSLDFLCKKASEIPVATAEPQVGLTTLPNSFHVISRVCRRDLVNTETDILSHQTITQESYASHCSRPLINPTSGPYKGLSLLGPKTWIPPEKVLCLGDGSGGFTWSVLRVYPHARVMYNSLSTPETSIQQSPSIPYVPSLAGWPSLEKRLMTLNSVNEGLSDINDPEFSSNIQKYGGREFQMIMCDAECPNYLHGQSPLTLAQSISSISHDLNSQTVFMKTYALIPEILRQQISILLQGFEHVEVIRSSFSSVGNTEVYLKAQCPIKFTPLIRTGDKLRGFQLPSQFVSFIQRVFLPSVKYHSGISMASIEAYSSTIHPEWKDVAEQHLLKELPFLFTANPLIYPHAVLRWIGQTTMKKPKFVNLRKRTLETSTFKTQYLQTWVIALLGVWSHLKQENPVWLNSHWNQIHLIWFRTRNGSWGISLYHDFPPSFEGTRDLKVWNVSHLLGSKGLKIIARIQGLLSIFDYPIVHLSSGMTNGPWDFKGDKLKPGNTAIHPWALENLLNDSVECPSLSATPVTRITQPQQFKRLATQYKSRI